MKLPQIVLGEQDEAAYTLCFSWLKDRTGGCLEPSKSDVVRWALHRAALDVMEDLQQQQPVEMVPNE